MKERYEMNRQIRAVVSRLFCLLKLHSCNMGKTTMMRVVTTLSQSVDPHSSDEPNLT